MLADYAALGVPRRSSTGAQAEGARPCGADRRAGRHRGRPLRRRQVDARQHPHGRRADDRRGPRAEPARPAHDHDVARLMPGGGAVIDTPGVRGFAPAGLDVQDLGSAFPEIAAAARAAGSHAGTSARPAAPWRARSRRSGSTATASWSGRSRRCGRRPSRADCWSYGGVPGGRSRERRPPAPRQRRSRRRPPTRSLRSLNRDPSSEPHLASVSTDNCRAAKDLARPALVSMLRNLRVMSKSLTSFGAGPAHAFTRGCAAPNGSPAGGSGQDRDRLGGARARAAVVRHHRGSRRTRLAPGRCGRARRFGQCGAVAEVPLPGHDSGRRRRSSRRT